MKRPALFAFLLSGVFVAACGQTSADALVGGWVRTRDTGEPRDRYTFAANASFAFDENKPDQPDAEDHLLGSYTASGGVITATTTNAPAAPIRMTFSYYAGPRHFTTVALLPRGPHDGVVGVWRGSARIERLGDGSVGPEGSDGEYTFRDDGVFYAVVSTLGDGGSTDVTAGQWTAEANDTFRITWTETDGVAVSHLFRLLDGEALADDGRVWTRE